MPQRTEVVIRAKGGPIIEGCSYKVLSECIYCIYNIYNEYISRMVLPLTGSDSNVHINRTNQGKSVAVLRRYQVY